MTAWLLNYNNGAATHTEKDTKIIRKKNEDEVTGGWVGDFKIPCLLISTEIICISNAIRDANKQPLNTQKTG